MVCAPFFEPGLQLEGITTAGKLLYFGFMPQGKKLTAILCLEITEMPGHPLYSDLLLQLLAQIQLPEASQGGIHYDLGHRGITNIFLDDIIPGPVA
ncbi:MAG: hypothetical protein IH820_04850, partial [Bacteroidetes bacterium]|nr:hypothetical protein [Bacteroidota bacterium]